MLTIGRSLSSPPDAPDHGDFIAEAAERLAASPAYRAIAAEESPELPVLAVATADIQRIYRFDRDPQQSVRDLVAAYERDDVRNRNVLEIAA